MSKKRSSTIDNEKLSPVVREKQELSTDKNYQGLLNEIQSIIAKGQYSAYKAVDNIKVQTYWQIGERIVREELANKDRADYGEYMIKNLSLDLGIDRVKLYRLVRFYRLYPIVATVSQQLSWSHYERLIEIEDNRARAFYQSKAIVQTWSVRELRNQVARRLYEKTSPKEIEEIIHAKLPAVIDTETIFGDSYNFQFTGLDKVHKEKEMEDKILSNIELFLKEMGEGFCFVGRQVPIKIGKETHKIDLVLYHRGIPCNVLVDLKVGKLEADHIGQMNKYVNYFRAHRQYAHEKDTIGLIICREYDKEEVYYALGGLEEKIFIAEYKVKLPSEEKIKKTLSEL